MLQRASFRRKTPTILLNAPLIRLFMPAVAVGALLALAERVDDEGAASETRATAQRQLLFHLRVLDAWVQASQVCWLCLFLALTP